MNCTSYDTPATVRDSRGLVLAQPHAQHPDQPHARHLVPEFAGTVGGGSLLPCMPIFMPPELLALAVTVAAFAETMELPFFEIEAAKRPAQADDDAEDDDEDEDEDEAADEEEDDDDEEDEDEEDDEDEEEEEDEFEESESGFDDDDDDDEDDEDFDDE